MSDAIIVTKAYKKFGKNEDSFWTRLPGSNPAITGMDIQVNSLNPNQHQMVRAGSL